MRNIALTYLTGSGWRIWGLVAAAGIIVSLNTGRPLASPPEQASARETDAVDREAIIIDMDKARHQAGTFGKEKASVGTIEVVPGKLGSGCRFRFAEGARGGFFTAAVQADDAWDRAAGFSFWLWGYLLESGVYNILYPGLLAPPDLLDHVLVG